MPIRFIDAYNYQTMRYIVRSVKYFIHFSLICAVIVIALALIGAVEGNINAIFSEGYDSIWKIALFFVAVAAVYPKVGFMTRGMDIDGEWADIRSGVLEYMTERGYVLENEGEGTVTFRFRSFTGKLSRMYEDRITLTKTDGGYQMEGLRKDVLRLVMGLEHRLSSKE